ncbi:MAG: hypothetical protein Q8L48_43155 [Archangium sp.]|nr:hypothetical protein [Archangium sp.]
MLFLPKGVPVATGLPASRDSVPEFLGRLARSGFTGYARYTFAASLVVLLFESGKLISVLVERGTVRVSGLDALTELCGRVASEDGSIDVYRLSPDLTMSLHGLLHGNYEVRAREMKLVDPKALTAKIKAERLNGCVRVYAGTRTSLIFYKDGVGFGFFHDGAETIETTATESQKIATLPGAKMDVLSTRSAEQLQAYDILEMVNLQKVWDASVRANQAQSDALHQKALAAERLQLESSLASLEASLQSIAAECVGPLGKNLVNKELAAQGGRACLMKPDQVVTLLAGIEKGARLVAGASKVREMVERLKAAVTQQLGATRAELG